MKIIFEANPMLKGIVGNSVDKFENGDENIHFSRFCITLKNDDGVLVYNTLVNSMVLLSNEEYDTHKLYNGDLSYLYEKHFLIKDDEYVESMANKIQGYIRTHKPNRNYKTLNTVTILPSTGCNAKCFYCFEKGSKIKHMSFETADKVIEFIKNHYNGRKIRIRWFGGEPLINEKVITYISEKLIENNIVFESTMTSNCFLIKEEKVSTYKDVWNLKRMSVTIDGTEDVYNNIKLFTYNGSAYEKVLKNIEVLGNNNIRVSIRINVGKHNLDNVEELIKELAPKFKTYKNVSIYLNRLYDNCDGAPINEEELSRVYNKVLEMTTLLRKYGKGGSRIKINQPFKTFSCMADSGNAVMILPDGKLGLCEHYMDELHIGDVENGITDFKNVVTSCEQVDKHETCFNCCLYPTCTKLKVCTGGTLCTKEVNDYSKYYIKRSMMVEYKKYKRNSKNE